MAKRQLFSPIFTASSAKALEKVKQKAVGEEINNATAPSFNLSNSKSCGLSFQRQATNIKN